MSPPSLASDATFSASRFSACWSTVPPLQPARASTRRARTTPGARSDAFRFRTRTKVSRPGRYESRLGKARSDHLARHAGDVHRVLGFHPERVRVLLLHRRGKPLTVRFLRENGLSLFFGVLLIGSLIGQSFAGLHQFNADAVTHHESTYTWLRYVTSSEFGGDVMENWQSEFLQFSLYILSTVWLIQRGSSESKSPGN